STISLPTPAEKLYYITTPIFYPNASPHIGHLYSLVTGDVFARYQRLNGRNVEYLIGTDEHRMKIQRAARLHFGGEAGREKEFCDALSERFRVYLGRCANISNTCFMRGSSEEHHRAVDHGWVSRLLTSKAQLMWLFLALHLRPSATFKASIGK
ncbi:tRNA synthetases class I (M)-domain-containing protein, partial [Gymnopilus junonius]